MNTLDIRKSLSQAFSGTDRTQNGTGFGGRAARTDNRAARPPSPIIRKSFTGQPTTLTEEQEARAHIQGVLASTSTAELTAAGISMEDFYGVMNNPLDGLVMNGTIALDKTPAAVLKLVGEKLSERTQARDEFKKAFGSPARWL